MKKLITLLVLAFATLGNAGELAEYKISEVEWKEGITFLKGTREKVTGIVRNYYSDGTLKAYVELKDGISHGKEIHYYRNGQKRHEDVFEDGESKEEWKFWFPDGRVMNLEEQKHLPEIDEKYS